MLNCLREMKVEPAYCNTLQDNLETFPNVLLEIGYGHLYGWKMWHTGMSHVTDKHYHISKFNTPLKITTYILVKNINMLQVTDKLGYGHLYGWKMWHTGDNDIQDLK
jgi:hypothetical protein